MDLLSIKLLALRAAPKWLRRRLMIRRFEHEVAHTGEVELSLLPQLIKPDGMALDVGANLGTYSYALAKCCRCVVAFEPNPAMVEALNSLALPRVEVRSCAVADKDAGATLYLPPGQAHVLASIRPQVVASYRVRQVPTKTVRLDSLALPRVSFIKIDVEGAEEAVLAGATALINRDRPSVLIEVAERHNPGGLGRLAATLGRLGYHGFFYRMGWQPLAAFSPSFQDVALLDEDRRLPRRAHRYINNFLFCPAEVSPC